MAVTVIPDVPGESWNLDSWLEYVAERKPGTGVFSAQQQQVTEVIHVPWLQSASCMRHLLGYSLSNNAAKLLTRPEVPCNHPWYPNLWCDSVSIQPWNPQGNTAYPGSITGTTQPKIFGSGIEFYAPEFTGKYGSAEVTAQFRPYPQLFYADWDPDWASYTGEEWRRFTLMSQMTPKLDLISAEGTDTGKFYFAEYDAALGPGNTQPKAGPPPVGTAFNGSVYVRKQVTSYEVCWRMVEEQYLTGAYPADITNGFVMPLLKRLTAYLGYVNNAALFGHPKNTLLYSGFRTQRYSFPGVRTNTDFGLIGHDIYLQFDQTDPLRPSSVKNSAGAVIADADRLRGHLVFPFRPSHNYWYAATGGSSTTQGTYTGSTILGQARLTDLFRHADDLTYPYPT